jgi:hypothetical protein
MYYKWNRKEPEILHRRSSNDFQTASLLNLYTDINTRQLNEMSRLLKVWEW